MRPDRIYALVAYTAAGLVLLVLGGIVVSLLVGAAPALREFGLPFVWSAEWDPVEQRFGALNALYGTVITSLIAMLIGVPVSFGIAVFLTELCPRALRQPLGIAVELLAAVPSIIYGMWGLFVLAPILADYVQPWLLDTLGPVPVLGALFSGPPVGIGILPAGLILAVMIIPFIASVMRDVFEIVPPVLKESAYGVGATTWEVVWNVVLPYTRVGVIGGVMLGLGRALGETMAVTFVIGNSPQISAALFDAGGSIASTLANEFAEAEPGLHLSSLLALGLLLFVLTFLVLAAARLMLARMARQYGSA
ncbi:MAG: phosphate ABC transporter permease subunit PstC [Burkholderiales bacterium]|nr:MAG: phosphate ABC transporter permease subunit PstC [Burkholderiales bacterium]